MSEVITRSIRVSRRTGTPFGNCSSGFSARRQFPAGSPRPTCSRSASAAPATRSPRERSAWRTPGKPVEVEGDRLAGSQRIRAPNAIEAGLQPRPRSGSLVPLRRGPMPGSTDASKVSRAAGYDKNSATTANVIALPGGRERSRQPAFSRASGRPSPCPSAGSPPVWPRRSTISAWRPLGAGRRRPRSEAPRSRLWPRARACGRPAAHRLLRLARVGRTTRRAGAVMTSATLAEAGIYLRDERIGTHRGRCPESPRPSTARATPPCR